MYLINVKGEKWDAEFHFIVVNLNNKGEIISKYIAKTDELGKFKHTMIYSKDKSKWKPKTMVVVCKGIDEYPWLFATNIHFKTRVEYI